MKDDFRIVFMGSPSFAVDSLNILLRNGYDVVGVVTVPDKPAGRGQLIRKSPVKEFALKNGIRVLQPADLKDIDFINDLRSLNADLQVVVAFRILPEIVWAMPDKGTINLHASLLPQYRGAAPINWSIINGEAKTGVTTFFLDRTIDTGRIIYSSEVDIGNNETAGELHDKLMHSGAELLLKTVDAITNDECESINQDSMVGENIVLNKAPKIFRSDCMIDWSKYIDEIHNKIRGLSPYPASATELISPDNKSYYIKIFRSSLQKEEHNLTPGQILSDSASYLKVAGKGGFVFLDEVQLSGKKPMNIKKFLLGFNLQNGWKTGLK